MSVSLHLSKFSYLPSCALFLSTPTELYFIFAAFFDVHVCGPPVLCISTLSSPTELYFFYCRFLRRLCIVYIYLGFFSCIYYFTTPDKGRGPKLSCILTNITAILLSCWTNFTHITSHLHIPVGWEVTRCFKVFVLFFAFFFSFHINMFLMIDDIFVLNTVVEKSTQVPFWRKWIIDGF